MTTHFSRPVEGSYPTLSLCGTSNGITRCIDQTSAYRAKSGNKKTYKWITSRRRLVPSLVPNSNCFLVYALYSSIQAFVCSLSSLGRLPVKCDPVPLSLVIQHQSLCDFTTDDNYVGGGIVEARKVVCMGVGKKVVLSCRKSWCRRL
jgi:hypothetical protein